jgi:hypothetical protein
MARPTFEWLPSEHKSEVLPLELAGSYEMRKMNVALEDYWCCMNMARISNLALALIIFMLHN